MYTTVQYYYTVRVSVYTLVHPKHLIVRNVCLKFNCRDIITTQMIRFKFQNTQQLHTKWIYIHVHVQYTFNFTAT